MLYNKVIQPQTLIWTKLWMNLAWIFPASVSWQHKVSPMKIPSLRDPRTFLSKCLLRWHVFSEREQRGYFNFHGNCSGWSNELFHWLILKNRLKVNQWTVTFHLCFTLIFVWIFSFAVDLPALASCSTYSKVLQSP